MARATDREMLPAWLGAEAEGDPWVAVEDFARPNSWRELVRGARELGLPVAGVGEISGQPLGVRMVAPPGARPGGLSRRRLRIVDTSSLWAGPLCGAVMAACGAEVIRVESTRRPDPSRGSTPDFFRRLNEGKAELAFDFTAPAGRRQLQDLVMDADVVISSARLRAFEHLGLSPEVVFAERPHLTWVAVSGYGWTGDATDRVAFGDDAAAAGGLVAWSAGVPRFLGDALADPLTGLAAAAGALEAVGSGGGLIVDAALARVAAGAAAELGFRDKA